MLITTCPVAYPSFHVLLTAGSIIARISMVNSMSFLLMFKRSSWCADIWATDDSC
jgi:hypothetical protein